MLYNDQTKKDRLLSSSLIEQPTTTSINTQNRSSSNTSKKNNKHKEGNKKLKFKRRLSLKHKKHLVRRVVNIKEKLFYKLEVTTSRCF
mmetsp:Transcript_25316/g.27650  ORF Transcript_25316/g.27650 Transcript_25316/m.27650 type:complete len:88 (+) Transcript_25316:3352-3615(+)